MSVIGSVTSLTNQIIAIWKSCAHVRYATRPSTTINVQRNHCSAIRSASDRRPANVHVPVSYDPAKPTPFYIALRCTGNRYSMGRVAVDKDDGKGLTGFGRYAGPATLILSSLADGVKHGYALTKDIEAFAGIRLAPGTLYEALARLDAQGLIEAVESEDRRRPYRLTAAGATALNSYLKAQRDVAEVGLKRLASTWALT